METKHQSMTPKPQFRIVREFIGGTLAGLTYDGIFGAPERVGLVCLKPCGGSPYRIVSCEPVTTETK